MEGFIRCKACNFIMEEGKLADVCPACGAPKAVFEPYKMTVSDKRRKVLDLHIHPIIVHFPQAFTLFSLFLFIIIPLTSGVLRENLAATASILITILPLTVLAGFLTGLYDGKLRFKKINTPILKTKKYLGTSFLALSIISAILINIPLSSVLWVLELLVLLGCTGLSGFLGKLGASLTDSRLPG